MARAASFAASGMHEAEVCSATLEPKPKSTRLPKGHYSDVPSGRPGSEDRPSGRERKRYIPPRDHPWRRFRLPGSPPNNKTRIARWRL